MGISFKFLQCKRAEPPEVESIECAVALKGSTSWSEPFEDYTCGISWGGAIVAPAEQIHIDPLTHKQFKVPQPNEKDIGDMFKFYGIDAEIYECPVCDLKGSLRTLLPHLNNTESGFIGTVYATPKPTPEVDRPASGEITIPSGDSFIGEIHESHGWTFKQLGEWLETLGY